jgi:DNA topoisomerase-2
MSEKYRKIEQREHVLLRPGMYIGSTEPERMDVWISSPDSLDRFQKVQIDYIPGLYKIFDEILVNALDHVTRLRLDPDASAQVRSIKIKLNSGSSEIVIENDGDGLPVVMHAETGLWVPELVFGNLLTGSNYDDSEERVIGGQNGIGAKACNIFSKMFRVETVDATRGKKFVQTFFDNMSRRTLAKVTDTTSKGFTRLSFIPDYTRFHSPAGLSNGMLALFRRRCIDMCALTPSDVVITLDSSRLKIKTFEKYVEMYTGSSAKTVHETIQTKWGP